MAKNGREVHEKHNDSNDLAHTHVTSTMQQHGDSSVVVLASGIRMSNNNFAFCFGPRRQMMLPATPTPAQQTINPNSSFAEAVFVQEG
mmetsp:Transcript_16158/g.34949  ORF Transcript_16158/g.34949 Transcript_16158/m.34949 type:complete len:88 (-) Transcript_16158:1692-1955(-)